MKTRRKRSNKPPANDPASDLLDELTNLDEHDADDESGGEDAAPDNPTTLAADVTWVYLHLDHPRVQRTDAGTAGRWNLLLWGRDERSRFYKSVVPRVLTTKADAEQDSQEEPDEPGTEGDDLLVAFFKDFEEQREMDRVSGTPQQIIDDAHALVESWAHSCGLVLSPACLLALTRRMAETIDACAIAAVKRPEQFERFVAAS